MDLFSLVPVLLYHISYMKIRCNIYFILRTLLVNGITENNNTMKNIPFTVCKMYAYHLNGKLNQRLK